MKITAVISEFNPFHKGHTIPLSFAKIALKSDYVLSIMSPDFVQRGEPAFFSKYERAKLSLLAGYDACINLSILSSISSAEDFATGAIKTIRNMGIVTDIVFGSEIDDINFLNKISDILLNETLSFKRKILSYMSSGMSYPKALSLSLKDEGALNDKDIDTISSPNFILAIEYIKAIKKYNLNIRYHIVKRKGGEYHGNNLSLSAESIRNYILNKKNNTLSKNIDILSEKNQTRNLDNNYIYNKVSSSNDNLFSTKKLNELFPIECIENTKKLLDNNMYVSWEDFSSILHISINNYFFSHKIKSDLDKRIFNLMYQYKNPTDFIDLLKSKNKTYSYIKRNMVRLLLSFDDKTFENAKFKSDDFPFYIHVLGFREKSKDILKHLKNKASVPIILNVKKDTYSLNSLSKYNFSLDIHSNDVWKIALTNKTKKIYPSMYSEKYPIII